MNCLFFRFKEVSFSITINNGTVTASWKGNGPAMSRSILFKVKEGKVISAEEVNQQGTLTPVVTPIKKFEDFTFGDFIDLDILIADGLTKHVIEIVSKLYGMPEEHAATIDINKVWSTLIALTKWREAQYREYDEFFNLSQSVEQDGPEMTINNLQLMWYEAVLVLADSHFLNIQHVVERPYKEALNYLTWKKNQVAQQQLANVKKKYDLQKRT